MQLGQHVERHLLADRLAPVDGHVADLADGVRGLDRSDADGPLERVVGEPGGEVVAVRRGQVLQVVDPLDDLLHDAAGVEHRRARIRAYLRLGADGVRMHVGPLSGEEVEVGGHGVSGKV